MLPISIDMGRVVQQRDNHLSFFFYENVVFGGWVHSVVKTANHGNELWVATFHVSSAADAKRFAKKHGVIRPEKW